jgi:hypothetical protein
LIILDDKARRKQGGRKLNNVKRPDQRKNKFVMQPKKKEPGLSKDKVFLYKPFVPLPDLSEFVNNMIEVSSKILSELFRSEFLSNISVLTILL